jgi:hypothetical protein
MEDHGKINWWYNQFIIITTECHDEFEFIMADIATVNQKL